jgi:hypothetical protein
VYHAAAALCQQWLGDFVKMFRIRRFHLAGLILACALWGLGGTVSSRIGPGFHSTIPAGYTVVTLKPSGATLSILGLIECPELEGAQQVSEGLNAKVVSAQGMPLRQFPRNFSFRVTASLRKTLIEPSEESVTTQEDPQQFLMKLWFRLKAHDGLEVREIQPQSVTMIGVPAEITYDERVFRVAFDVGNLPVTDRLVLEVLSPEGDTLAHFTFALL